MMARMKFKILLAILCLIGLPVYGSNPYTIRVSPSGYVPHNNNLAVHINVHIDRDATNRGGTVELVSEDYYARSDFDIAGANAPATWGFDYRGMGAGEYVAILTVHKLVGGKWKEVTAQSEKLIILD